MDAIDDDLFEVVLIGPYVPTKLAHTTDNANKEVVKILEEWIENEKKLVQLDKRPTNILFMALEDELFENVVKCTTAKEVWEALLVMYEGI